MDIIHVPVSPGEVLDKITILEIKSERISDAEKLKRFRHFVNSEDNDDNLHYVVERGQRRPARKDEIETQIVEVVET